MYLQVLYGGTFDPVHNGHLAVACNARDRLRAVIRMMPAADPPHKGPTHASAMQRAQMLQLAIADQSGLVLDRRELERRGASYTVDTLQALRACVGEHAPWAILIGADSFMSLPTWKQWRSLFDLAHIVVAARPGSPIDIDLSEPLADMVRQRWVSDPAALSIKPSGAVFRLDQTRASESASQVRRLIADSGSWQQLVPPTVAEYIMQQGLYR